MKNNTGPVFRSFSISHHEQTRARVGVGVACPAVLADVDDGGGATEAIVLWNSVAYLSGSPSIPFFPRLPTDRGDDEPGHEAQEEAGAKVAAVKGAAALELSAAQGCLHGSHYRETQETQLGQAQGRPCKVDERQPGAGVYPGRRTQFAGP